MRRKECLKKQINSSCWMWKIYFQKHCLCHTVIFSLNSHMTLRNDFSVCSKNETRFSTTIWKKNKKVIFFSISTKRQCVVQYLFQLKQDSRDSCFFLLKTEVFPIFVWRIVSVGLVFFCGQNTSCYLST